MSIGWLIFGFDSFELDEEEGSLYRDGAEVPLTPTEFKILLVLLRNLGKKVANPDLIDEVWSLEKDVNENTIVKHVNSLRRKLDSSDTLKYIATGRKAYRFHFAPVDTRRKYASEAEPLLPEAKSQPPAVPHAFELRHRIAMLAGIGLPAAFFIISPTLNAASELSNEHFIFVFIAAFSYGALVCIGLMLECAYGFDRYGWLAARMLPSIFLLNCAAMFFGLLAGSYFRSDGTATAVAVGVSSLTAAAIASAIIGSIVLPTEALVDARFQTQSAIGAFLKNLFLYFLPLYSIFVVLVFDLSLADGSKSLYPPIALAILLTTLFAFSFVATNYLSDNLIAARHGNPVPYHGLYSSLLQLRTVFCFVPTLASVIWYFLVCFG